MKLINVDEHVDLKEKIQVEMDVETLAIIHALAGGSSISSTRELIDNSYAINPKYSMWINSKTLEDIYRRSLEILRKKGICNEVGD